ncbi:MAG: glycosyltransferase family 2 protein [Clostridia bacterium]|nr:glycosyltransferase family 2 protein [Clostridia bacterium]
MDLISIIVPVYNVEKYIHQCVDSIINQTYTNLEIILVDDGSPDNCGRICDEYAAKDSRIKVIHQANQGLSAARNAGVALSNAEWISFVDSDDIIHPQAIELMFSALKKEKADISTAHMTNFEDGNIPDSFYSKFSEKYTINEVNEEFLSEIFPDSRYHSACNRIINKKFLIEFPFEVGRYHEDSPVISKILYFSQRMVIVPYELYFYRNNQNSITRTNFTLKNLDLLWAWEQQIEFYKSIGFKKMQKILEFQYFFSAGKFYNNILESKDIDHTEAKKLKRYTFRKYFHILFCEQFPLNERLYCFEFFSVKTAMIFWVILGYVNKFKNKINADNAN